MRCISKDITKHYLTACSSMSYTLFAFYGLMFSMCLFCLFLRLFCYMCVARQKRRQSPTDGIDGATSVAQTSGGGGTSSDMRWCEKDEDYLHWAYRAMRYAHAKH